MKVSTVIPLDIAESIRAELARVEDVWAGHPAHVGAIAQAAGAIPLVLDAGGFCAMKPDGTVVEISWETPKIATEVVSRRLRDIALKGGSRQYPLLTELLPARSAASTPCPQCVGTGTHPLALAAGIENLVCWCGGLGWIPDYWEEAPPK